jgi:hypothetical protein
LASHRIADRGKPNRWFERYGAAGTKAVHKAMHAGNGSATAKAAAQTAGRGGGEEKAGA